MKWWSIKFPSLFSFVNAYVDQKIYEKKFKTITIQIVLMECIKDSLEHHKKCPYEHIIEKG